MIVTLERLHIDFAEKVAARRQAAAVEKRRPAANGAPTDPMEAQRLHRLGACCEAAAKLALNPIEWNAFAEDLQNLPDLGDFIDVKGRARVNHSLICQATTRPHWAYLLITAENHPRYVMSGWIWGSEAIKEKFWRDPVGGRGAYFIPESDLHPFEDLRRIVRLRQKNQEGAA